MTSIDVRTRDKVGVYRTRKRSDDQRCGWRGQLISEIHSAVSEVDRVRQKEVEILARL